jgi:hypothetical protein
MNYKARVAALILLLGSTGIAAPAAARDGVWPYRDRDLAGQWIFSGELKFAAPIPFAGILLRGAPPHAQFQRGDKIGLWGSILGTMTFDGNGVIKGMQDVFKPGEVEPAPPFPPFVPPIPEVGTGSYAVSPDGSVSISIVGRDPNSPEGQVDFETEYHCQLNRFPREMTCVFARFTTYFVDPNGYHAPITGIITFRKRY